MKYGEGFWCVKEGVRLPRRIYPATRGFEYLDGTGDCGEFLLEDWCFDYVAPGSREALRMTIAGNLRPVLHRNSFDFDWASIPRPARAITCDKADYRIRAGCLPHDMGFCVQEVLPGLDRTWWNTLLFEIMEAYSVTWDETKAGSFKSRLRMKARYLEDRALRNGVLAGVTLGGPFVWGKTPEEIAVYRRLFKVERMAV